MLTAILGIAASTLMNEDVIIITDNINHYGGLFKSCRSIDDLYNNQDMKKLSVYDNIKDIEDFCIKLAKGVYITDIRTGELMRNVAKKAFREHDKRLYLFDPGALTNDAKFNQGLINHYLCIFNDAYTKKRELIKGLSTISDVERVKTILVCNKVEYKSSDISDVVRELKIKKSTVKMFPRIDNFRSWNTNNHIFNFVYRTLSQVGGLQEYRNPILNILKEIGIK